MSKKEELNLANPLLQLTIQIDKKLFDVMGKKTKINPVSIRNGVKKEESPYTFEYQQNKTLA